MSDRYVVLVCGGRDFGQLRGVENADTLNKWARLVMGTTLGTLHEKRPITRIVHGAASGADTLAGKWAAQNGVDVGTWPADWNAHGRAAGPMRNALMLSHERPDLVVAFPGGRGTADMVKRAKARGVEVLEVE